MNRLQVAGGKTLRDVLKRLGALDLETSSQHRPDLWTIHPRSGYLVRNDMPRPVPCSRDGLPGIQDMVPGPFGMGEQPVPSSLRAPHYLYRAVSEDDWNQSLVRGYLKSDGRMNLASSEGTVASYGDPSFYLPGQLASNKPGHYAGRILRIDYDPSDGWRHDQRDSYLKTSRPVPIERVGMISPKIVVIRGPRPHDQEIELGDE